MTDYSQGGEQQAILQIVDDWKLEPPAARFLDIGAWNPFTFSHSRVLFERGWGGVVVEPSPTPLLALLDAYGAEDRVDVIGAAIGSDSKLIRFHVSDDAVSTSEPESFTRWSQDAKFRGAMLVPQIGLAELLNQIGGNFEVVSIDTEGTSANLFFELLRIGPRPRCVVVEHDGRTVEVATHAQEQGYQVKLITPENVVFEWTGRRE